MNQFNRDRHEKKLRHLLSCSNDEEFLNLVWAVDALQSGREGAAGRQIRFPPEAQIDEIDSPYAVFKWDLETLVNQLLMTPKCVLRPGHNRILRCQSFDVIALVINILKKLEGAELKIYLNDKKIMMEMHRIAQRTFDWQRGFFNQAQYYRYHFIYGRGNSREFFESTKGLTVGDFSLACFLLFATFQESPVLNRNLPTEPLGLTPEKFELALKLISISGSEARTKATGMLAHANRSNGRRLPTNYQPSVLRQFPILSYGRASENIRAPLVQLIAQRSTSGLYYDLVAGGERVLGDANKRFELYTIELIDALMADFDVGGSKRYRFRGNNVDTIDVLVRRGEEVVIAIECKATRLTFDAQFSDDPVSLAYKAYNQISKGVFQVWRYFSHARRGIMTVDAVAPNAHGVVVTLDTWLSLSAELQQEMMEAAGRLADEDPEITDQDRRPVIFCSIADLESLLVATDEDGFLKTLASAVLPEYLGWAPQSICEAIGVKFDERRQYPFELADVIPWWSTMQSEKKKRGRV